MKTAIDLPVESVSVESMARDGRYLFDMRNVGGVVLAGIAAHRHELHVAWAITEGIAANEAAVPSGSTTEATVSDGKTRVGLAISERKSVPYIPAIFYYSSETEAHYFDLDLREVLPRTGIGLWLATGDNAHRLRSLEIGSSAASTAESLAGAVDAVGAKFVAAAVYAFDLESGTVLNSAKLNRDGQGANYPRLSYDQSRDDFGYDRNGEHAVG